MFKVTIKCKRFRKDLRAFWLFCEAGYQVAQAVLKSTQLRLALNSWWSTSTSQVLELSTKTTWLRKKTVSTMGNGSLSHTSRLYQAMANSF